MAEDKIEKNWINASDEPPATADWKKLEAEGKVKYYQGSPATNDRYNLPKFDPRRAAPIAGLDLCFVYIIPENAWAIAPANVDADAWSVAAAYVRLGYIPPLHLADRFERYPRIIPDETRRVIAVMRIEVQERMDRLHKISQVMGEVLRVLPW